MITQENDAPRTLSPAPRSPKVDRAAGWWLALVAVGLATVTVAGLAVLVSLRIEQGLATARARIAHVEEQQERLRGQIEDMELSESRLRDSLDQLRARFERTPDDSAVARAAGRSVLTVITGAGSGSGFAVRRSGGGSEIVTNFHVVASDYAAGRRTVRVTRGHSSWTGRVVEVSESNDLAVISVRRRLPTLSVATKRPAVGDPLLVLGSPLGLGGTVTSGIVSAYRDDFGADYLQFSAPISPGNSGGPVIDEHGRVVGVAVAKMVMTGAEGIGFAIPSSRLCVSLSVC